MVTHADQDVRMSAPEVDILEKEKCAFFQLQDHRRSLPIYKHRRQLLQAIADNQILVIAGETGSEKFTQIPQYLHESGYTKHGKVGCILLDDDDDVVKTVAGRVSEELGFPPGCEVGYSIPFENCISNRTLIKYMTNEMLLREFLDGSDYASYSVMMVGEAHERTLSTEILIGLLKDIVHVHCDLKLLITVDSREAQKFSAYFNNARVFEIHSSTIPVGIQFKQAPVDTNIANLANVVLILKSLGIHDLFSIDLINPLPEETLLESLGLLFALGAINKDGKVTKTGVRMVAFPLGCMLSKMIVASEKYKCSKEVITIAAMLSVGSSVFYRSKDKAVLADNTKMNFSTEMSGNILLY